MVGEAFSDIQGTAFEAEDAAELNDEEWRCKLDKGGFGLGAVGEVVDLDCL